MIKTAQRLAFGRGEAEEMDGRVTAALAAAGAPGAEAGESSRDGGGDAEEEFSVGYEEAGWDEACDAGEEAAASGPVLDAKLRQWCQQDRDELLDIVEGLYKRGMVEQVRARAARGGLARLTCARGGGGSGWACAWPRTWASRRRRTCAGRRTCRVG